MKDKTKEKLFYLWCKIPLSNWITHYFQKIVPEKIIWWFKGL